MDNMHRKFNMGSKFVRIPIWSVSQNSGMQHTDQQTKSQKGFTKPFLWWDLFSNFLDKAACKRDPYVKSKPTDSSKNFMYLNPPIADSFALFDRPLLAEIPIRKMIYTVVSLTNKVKDQIRRTYDVCRKLEADLRSVVHPVMEYQKVRSINWGSDIFESDENIRQSAELTLLLPCPTGTHCSLFGLVNILSSFFSVQAKVMWNNWKNRLSTETLR